jgi:tetratricopeptide (TPR) repeat protein
MAAIRRSPAWALEHGLMPREFARIVAASRSGDGKLRARALERVAGLYTVLGAHEEQVALDEKLLRIRPQSKGALRRLVHGLLLLDRPEEAWARAQRLLKIDPRDTRSHAFFAVARRAQFPSEPGDPVPTTGAGWEDSRAPIHRLPVFTRDEATHLLSGVNPPPARRK